MIGLGLGQLVGVLNRLESRDIHIDSQQCSRLRHKNSRCTLCVEHCPERAITVQGCLQIDSGKCIGCGICAAVCPTGALEASGPTNTELVNRIEQRKYAGSIAFSCPKAESGSDGRVLPVNCLGRLDESILISAVSFGIQQVLLVDGPCQGCSNAIGRTVSAQAVAESNAIVRAFGISADISFVSQLPPTSSANAAASASGELLSRRAFFTMLTRETKAVAAMTVSTALEGGSEKGSEVKKGELPQRIPSRRQLLLAACRRLGQPTSAEFETLNGSWATCQIKENCTGCQMCAFFCPTGALVKTEHKGKRGLDFRVARCMNCHLCQDSCFWNAVSLSQKINLDRALKDSSVAFDFASEGANQQTPEAKQKRLIRSIRQ